MNAQKTTDQSIWRIIHGGVAVAIALLFVAAISALSWAVLSITSDAVSERRWQQERYEIVRSELIRLRGAQAPKIAHLLRMYPEIKDEAGIASIENVLASFQHRGKESEGLTVQVGNRAQTSDTSDKYSVNTYALELVGDYNKIMRRFTQSGFPLNERLFEILTFQVMHNSNVTSVVRFSASLRVPVLIKP